MDDVVPLGSTKPDLDSGVEDGVSGRMMARFRSK
jgi:hypothetical protein